MSDMKFGVMNFQKGSYPMIESKADSNFFFILKSGQVSKTSSALTFNSQKEEILGPGDFFGVISCMAQRPRLDTVEALTDIQVIVVRKEQFPALIRSNTPIAMKILRYFSRQLRYFNQMFTHLSFREAGSEDPAYLYEIANYYSTKRMNFSYSAYALLRYLQYCPNGEYVATAKSRLVKIVNEHKDKLKLEPKKDGFHYIFEPDQLIFLENEPGHELYIIQDGEVRISKILKDTEALLNILKKGDIFGEMAILENKPRNAMATAVTQVRLMAVNKNNFDQVVQDHPELAKRIVELLADRIWFMHRHIANMLITDPETRLYDALYITLMRDRINFRAGGAYRFDMGFDDLLKFTGLQNEKGREALEHIFRNNKNFTVMHSKIQCNEISKIESHMNLIQRNAQLQSKIGESAGSFPY